MAQSPPRGALRISFPANPLDPAMWKCPRIPKLKLRLRPSMDRIWGGGLLQSMKHVLKNRAPAAADVVDLVVAAVGVGAVESAIAGN